MLHPADGTKPYGANHPTVSGAIATLIEITLRRAGVSAPRDMGLRVAAAQMGVRA